MSTDCPQCGSPLVEVHKGPDDAPWLCAHCHLGFWAAELSGESRTHWRASHRDFGRGPHVAGIHAARDSERKAHNP